MKYLALLIGVLLPCFTSAQSHWEDSLKRAMQFEQNGKRSDAFQIAENMRKSNPKDSMYLMGTLFYAEIYGEEHNFRAALKYVEELAQLMPEQEAENQEKIMECKKFIGDIPGAIKAGKRIIEINPENGIVYNNLASIYNYNKNYSAALQTLKSSSKPLQLQGEILQYTIAFYGLRELDSAKRFVDMALKDTTVQNGRLHIFTRRRFTET